MSGWVFVVDRMVDRMLMTKVVDGMVGDLLPS